VRPTLLPVVLPVAIFSFLGGVCLGKSRRGLSMLPPERSSPLPGVPRLAWEKFVAIMVVAPKAHRSKRGRLGYFGMDARRLADLELVRNPRKVRLGGEDGVWAGDWVAPLTEDGFLGSAEAQLEAFNRSCRRLASKAAPHVGEVVDGRRASLSGLLAVGHLAGEEGIAGWTLDPAVRKRFEATTARFAEANGIF